MAKILLIDIETAPNIAYVWGAWKQDIGQNQWKEKAHIMSFAAKWLGNDTIIYQENRKANDKAIVKAMFKLLDEADIVIAHNGKKFDIPTILSRGLVHGLNPPSPYHIIDTLTVARTHFRFLSNSLGSLADELKLTKKGTHKKFPGFELWLACLRGNDEAWKEMEEYNIQDLIALEELYLTLRPYIRNHPVVTRTLDSETYCPKCGGSHIQWRGYAWSKSGLAYHRFQCQDCHGWGRAKSAERNFTQENRSA